MEDKAVTISQNLQLNLSADAIERIARKTGFMKRRSRKINPASFVKTFLAMTFMPVFSLRIGAIVLGILTGTVVSKVALFKRLTPSSVDFMHQLLFAILARVSQLNAEADKGVFDPFHRVFIQDSTNLPLPIRLANLFPGSRNQTGKRSSSLKLQTVYEVLSESFHLFRLTPFNVNDQSAAPLILEILQEGDLILRDLGYFVLKIFKAIGEKNAYYLSRYHHKPVLFDEDGKRFDLLKYLRKYGTLDQWLYIGIKEKLFVRVVAIPMPESVAAERRRKLRQNRNNEINPGKTHLALLGWAIFITNVGEQIWNMETVCQLYGIRWRIEIIFKSWKSHFHIHAFAQPTPTEVKLLIYSRLISITLFQTCLYGRLTMHTYETTGSHLSLLKLAQFFHHNFWVIQLFISQDNPSLIMEQILKHCTYEKRKKRKNYGQILHPHMKDRSSGYANTLDLPDAYC